MDENRHSEYTAAPRQMDTGLACLIMLARFHNVAASAEQVKHEFEKQLFSPAELMLAARRLGLKSRLVTTTLARLISTPLPAIAIDNCGRFFIIARVDQDQCKILIHDPCDERADVISAEELQVRWAGKLILLRPEAGSAGGISRFDFTWFIPAIVKYRKLLGEVLLVSFVLQIFALLTPLFFQVVMDKVLVHHGLTTLDVVAVGLLAIMLFESALSGLRTYVFAHTASRIDVELGSRLFQHLVNLPLAYFQARRVGDSVARVRELENIRSFLTGNSITLVLDVMFSVVFVAVMFYYSAWLTLVVLLSLPLYVLISALITPILRARLQESFSRGAENQAFLV